MKSNDIINNDRKYCTVVQPTLQRGKGKGGGRSEVPQFEYRVLIITARCDEVETLIG
jgi:hypothetical protein